MLMPKYLLQRLEYPGQVYAQLSFTLSFNYVRRQKAAKQHAKQNRQGKGLANNQGEDSLVKDQSSDRSEMKINLNEITQH